MVNSVINYSKSYDVKMKREGVTSKSFIRVIWEDDANNFSKDKQALIKAYFKDKYNTNNIVVNFKPNTFTSIHKSELNLDTEESIIDVGFQRKLFKEWLELNHIDVNFDTLLRLDNRVNDVLKNDKEVFDLKSKRWEIKHIQFDNFLSYADNNILNYENLRGLTVVNSIPQNQGGKSILTVDLLLFLFFNTTSKTSKVAEIFNLYTDKDYVKVKGDVVIDDNEYIIERNLFRKSRKNGDYTYTQELNFYKVLPDGSLESLQEEKRQETEKLINKVIGNETDFLLTVISTSDNLEDLINAKATQRSNVLNRFLGLEHLQLKEETAKKLLQDWRIKLKSNLFDIDGTLREIRSSEEFIKNSEEECCKMISELENKESEFSTLNTKRDTLLSQKKSIDVDFSGLNINEIKNNITKIEERKNGFLNKISDLDIAIEKIQILFNENEYEEVISGVKKIELGIGEVNLEVKKTNRTILELRDGLVCPTCRRAFENSEQREEDILKHQKKLDDLVKREKILKDQLNKGKERLSALETSKKQIEEHDKLTILKDKALIDVEHCDIKLNEYLKQQKIFEENSKHIEENIKLEKEILAINYELDKLKEIVESLKKDHQRKIFEVEQKKSDILSKKKLIEEMKKEYNISKVFEHYIAMVGKNGIAKIILKNVIPLINMELEKLLFDIVNFNLRLDVDENRIEFWMDDGKKLKPLRTGSGFEKVVGALALRCVLSKVNCLPTPSILVLDEPFGKVALENLEDISHLLDRIKEFFNQVFLITHNPVVKEWGDNFLMVKKVDDISTIE